MKNIDWFSYIKLFLGLSMIFPLEWAFWSLNFGTSKGFVITIAIHMIVFALGALMFNYLETGSPFKSSKKFAQ